MVLGLALFFVAAAARHAMPQEAPTFPAGIELVRIDVVVIDREGWPVTGLTAADFEITEKGQPHRIASFEPIVVRPTPTSAWTESPTPVPVSEPLAHSSDQNRCFLVFFDDVHVDAPHSERVRVELVRFLQREMRDGDWVRILAPAAGLDWTARTPFEYQQIPTAVRRLKGELVRDPFRDGITDFEAMNSVEYGSGSNDSRSGVPSASTGGGPDSRGRVQRSLMAASQVAEERYAVAKRRVRRTLAALTEAVTSLGNFRGRKSLILYSEGFIKAPHMREYDQVVGLARAAHVAIYFVDAQGLTSGLTGADDDSATANPVIRLETESGGASYLAIATGGRASISNDLTGLFREAAIESSAYYLLGFEPSAGGPGDRKIKVRVLRDGLRVLAPDRYVVGPVTITGRKKETPAAVQAVASVADATDLRPRVATSFLAPARGQETTTTFAIELDPDQTIARQLDLLIEARPLGRGKPLRDSALFTVPARSGPARFTREMRLPPGVWQARVVLRDVRTGRLGSVLHTFEVPSPDGLRR
jgi:VWFA-related protein